ncbi:hypothetical protein THS27_01320 [Thalassospira sp. MCCC 1A01428]|nr:hypothetical protein THS27_01320 [Thalassospira sp. MCCC 1A01428]
MTPAQPAPGFICLQNRRAAAFSQAAARWRTSDLVRERLNQALQSATARRNASPGAGLLYLLCVAADMPYHEQTAASR